VSGVASTLTSWPLMLRVMAMAYLPGERNLSNVKLVPRLGEAAGKGD